MSVELTTKYAPQTDELFKAESKISLLTNTDLIGPVPMPSSCTRSAQAR